MVLPIDMIEEVRFPDVLNENTIPLLSWFSRLFFQQKTFVFWISRKKQNKTKQNKTKQNKTKQQHQQQQQQKHLEQSKIQTFFQWN